MPESAKTLTVTRLVRRMRNLLEIELGEVWVEGEISNVRRQSSGHVYFTLKDEGAQISCAMFRGNAVKSKVQPEHGEQVKAFGEISVYEARGSVQLIVRKLEAVGAGDLQARFEALKKKLNAEGLFDADKKLPLPKFPMSVGLITSGSGAALQDMLHVLERRAPWIQPYLYPVQVQGKGAEQGIARAIREWSDWEVHNLPEVDVIIVGRGGGSLEDLWNFNEEVVARAIADCRVPIVSGVGHEIDFTIADFVADQRAPTPSAAAEMISPDQEAIKAKLEKMKSSMQRQVSTRIEKYSLLLENARKGVLARSADRVLREPLQRLIQVRRDLDDAIADSVREREMKLRELGLRLKNQQPQKRLERRMERLAGLNQRLNHEVVTRLVAKRQNLEKLTSLLKALGPESVLGRGYSITLKENGEVLRDPAEVAAGEQVITKLKDGELRSRVE